ncbi:porin family protein [Winogradskyella alexanderae]|uniref:PorT family protein n=1 Tax=Winogradskyella alexanderae TaxID=2877123 RepID=A0ABS7XNR3_9FLAO|nr:porin family protein [Winogradskyella alexanderae]MCA0131653.1 PorT family protein [Winogradskyella alexanderae]
MRKLLVCGLVAIFSLTFLNAQDENTTMPISFGVKTGVNFSDIAGDDVESYNGRTAFHFGGVVEIPICESFSLQPELIYSAQGSDYEDPGESGTAKVDYLNLPVIAKYYPIEGFSIEAGPQLGYLLSAKFDVDGEEFDFKDDLKSIDFGVNFGLGYKLENGLNFSARYNLGITNANDSDELDGGAEYRNSVIQVGVGFFF